VLTIGNIEVHPPREEKFLASCSVHFLDENGQEIMVVHDFALGKSHWDINRIFVAAPVTFHRVYRGGIKQNQTERSVEFAPRFWHELSARIIAAYQHQLPELAPITPDIVVRMGGVR